MSFSPSGATLATLGQDTLHSIVILKSCTTRWLNDIFISSSINVSIPKMFWILHSDESSEFPIITGGNRCLYYFKPVGKTLEKVKGTFGRKRKLQSILCSVEILFSSNSLLVASTSSGSSAFSGSAASLANSTKLSIKDFDPNNQNNTNTNSHQNGGNNDNTPNYLENVLLTGTVSGHVYFWLNQRVKTTLTAHDAPIYTICALNHYSGGRFATGGKDGLVKIWSESLQLLHTYNLQTFSPSPFGLSCHSLITNQVSSKLAIGKYYFSFIFYFNLIFILF